MSKPQPTPATPSDALISAGENRRMFDAIAPRYDRMNRLLSFGLDMWWRRIAIDALAPRSGGHYLDLGCGTGDLAFAISRRAPAATVVGLDPAERMLDVARQRLSSAPTPNVTFRTGDASASGMPDSTLDGVITAFCVRNLTNRRAAWAEIMRTLSPGGRLVILELTRPRNALLRTLHRVYTRGCVPVLGRLFANGQAYRYLVDSVEQFASPECIATELRLAGFAPPTVRPLTGGVVTLIVTQRPGGATGAPKGTAR
jgi:demethylmenaquinone methyltransferase/2-methoxy-6-polyprenyl-1,4-benzoquinol methylase